MGGVFRLGTLAAALVLLAGCGGKTEQPPLWIGHISPLSGPNKSAGESARRAIRLAVEEANKNPDDDGAGRPVRVLHTNSRGDPAAFGAEATRLVRVNRVVGLLGGMNEKDIQEFRRLEGTGVCLVSPAGSVGESARGGNVFFTGLAPAQQGRALARFAEEKGFTHVVVLADAEDSAGRYRAVADAFKERFMKVDRKKSRRRRQVLLTGPWFYGQDTSLEKRAGQIVRQLQQTGKSKKVKIDAILLAGEADAVVKLREALRSSRLPVLFGGDEGSSRTLLEEPEAGQGVYLAKAFVPDAGTGQAKTFAKHFKQRFAEEPDVYAALAYDDARILFTALRQAKALEADAIRDALAGLKDFPSLTGPLSFNSRGQAERTIFIVRIEKGKAVKLKRY
jgi:branched-chain amino acid transport system substrate-binding protein